MARMSRVVIIGGGPGGYESALVAAQLGAEVIVVDTDGLGGSAVLTDCVPSKTLIATAEVMTDFAAAGELGIITRPHRRVDLGRVNQRVKSLALAQSADIDARLAREGVRVVRARGSLDGPGTVLATAADGSEERYPADAMLIATGAAPSTLPTAMPDGERILTWEQVYDLDRDAGVPDRRRLRRDGGRVRQRLPRARDPGDAGQPATGSSRARTRTPPRSSRTCSSAAA